MPRPLVHLCAAASLAFLLAWIFLENHHAPAAVWKGCLLASAVFLVPVAVTLFLDELAAIDRRYPR